MEELKKISLKFALILAFLLVANQVYRLFILEPDLQEHSDLINLVRELPDSATVVYLGESSNFTFGDYDLNTKRISDLTSEYYPGEVFGTISHGALHAGNYKVLIGQIPENKQVQTLIVTMNLRSFNTQWIESKLETSLAKSMVLLKEGPPLLKRAILSFKAYDIKTDSEREKIINKRWENNEIFLADRDHEITVNQWTAEILSLPDSIMPQPQRLLGMHYIRTYAFEIDTLHNPRVKDFDRIVEIAKERGWNLVFNLMAENTEKAAELVGPDLVRIMRNNAMLLCSRYTEMGVIVVNNLEAVPDPSFLDRNWTTEHYDEKGRKIVAENLALSMQNIFPEEFTSVKYMDTLQRSTFFNDCEGSVRWFQMGTCSREQAYSGEYSSKINREDPFSIGFTRPVNMIPSNNLNRVVVDLFYFQAYESSDAQVVMEILGGDEKSVWINYHISDSKPPLGEWIQVNTSFNIPEVVHSHKLLKVYVWNPGKKPVFIDDLHIQFE